VPWQGRDTGQFQQGHGGHLTLVDKALGVTAIVFGDDEAQQGIAPSVVDADGNRVEQFEPGLIAYARGGKDIRFEAPCEGGRVEQPEDAV
jgi:hypothetical protein